MKKNKKDILEAVIAREGGFSDHKHDRGGETRYGVTAVVARRHGYYGDMRDLPIAVAQEIFAAEYWGYVRADDLPAEIREQVVDFCVLAGPARAAKTLQQAVNAFGASLLADGVVGSKTIQAAHEVKNKRALSIAYSSIVGMYFIDLSKRVPSQRDFLAGWLANRVIL